MSFTGLALELLVMRSSEILDTAIPRAKKRRWAATDTTPVGVEVDRRARFAVFLLHVEAARRAAVSDPAQAARLLAAWMSSDG